METIVALDLRYLVTPDAAPCGNDLLDKLAFLRTRSLSCHIPVYPEHRRQYLISQKGRSTLGQKTYLPYRPMLPTLQQGIYLARMHRRKPHHNHKHQHGVKDVQPHFHAQEVPAVTLCELYQPEHTSHPDDDRSAVQHIYVSLPWQGRVILYTVGGLTDKAVMEHASDSYKEAEYYDLNAEPGDDDSLADICGHVRAL